ncbi:Arm DNA-binding domain-containing protein [Paraburkholderia metrosideri]|uniref:Arm DNA-binding domain-containing protein n=1 Tax=Paraburkholderia metrosideri TaxID=580937 RepID=UPI0038B72EA9
MPLTEAAIRSTKAAEKARKLFDAGGLYLLITPSGGTHWRLKYRFGGKEKSLSFGTYPDVTLAAARKLRDEARAFLIAGVDPGEVRKQERATLRDEAARLDAAMRFSLDSDGALSIRFGERRMNLSPPETAALRAFLDATRGVSIKE